MGIDNCVWITDNLVNWIHYSHLLLRMFEILKWKVERSQRENIHRNSSSPFTGTTLLS